MYVCIYIYKYVCMYIYIHPIALLTPPMYQLNEALATPPPCITPCPRRHRASWGWGSRDARARAG